MESFWFSDDLSDVPSNCGIFTDDPAKIGATLPRPSSPLSFSPFEMEFDSNTSFQNNCVSESPVCSSFSSSFPSNYLSVF